MLVVTRYRVPPAEGDAFLAEAGRVLALLSVRPGFVHGSVGRAADDEQLWLLATEWAGAGAYRRALSSYEVKTGATALLSTAVDEPTAYELHLRADAETPSGGE